jgi:hypothetical protein
MCSHVQNITLPISTIFSAEQRNKVLALMVEYSKSLETRLFAEHKEMKQLERKNLRQFEQRGEVFDDQKKLLDEKRSLVNKLRINVGVVESCAFTVCTGHCVVGCSRHAAARPTRGGRNG